MLYNKITTTTQARENCFLNEMAGRGDKMNAQTMTLMEIRNAGLEALMRELGPVGTIRFLQQYEIGQGDYSQERHAWLDELDIQTIADQVLAERGKESK
jgi:hypothetical protein